MVCYVFAICRVYVLISCTCSTKPDIHIRHQAHPRVLPVCPTVVHACICQHMFIVYMHRHVEPVGRWSLDGITHSRYTRCVCMCVICATPLNRRASRKREVMRFFLPRICMWACCCGLCPACSYILSNPERDIPETCVIYTVCACACDLVYPIKKIRGCLLLFAYVIRGLVEMKHTHNHVIFHIRLHTKCKPTIIAVINKYTHIHTQTIRSFAIAT